MLTLMRNAQFRDYLLADRKIRMQCSSNFFNTYISINVDLENETIEEVSVDDKAAYVAMLDNLDFTVSEANTWDELVEMLDANIIETAKDNYFEIFKKRENETLADYCQRIREFSESSTHEVAEFLEADINDTHSDADRYVGVFSDNSAVVETDSDDLAYDSLNDLLKDDEQIEREAREDKEFASEAGYIA